jgi:hypothetical protein
MAGTNDNPTPISLISLSAARDLVVETLLSRPWAEQLIIKWLHSRPVRWQYRMVKGQPAPARTLEQEAKDLWAQPTRVLVEWREGYACRVTVYRKDKAGRLKPLRRVTVIGILIVREDIERELAQMPVTLAGNAAAANQLRPPEGPQSSSEKPQLEPAKKWRPDEALKWLAHTMRCNSQGQGESKNAWARRLYNHMKADFEDQIPWSEWGTLRRRMDP